jgi:hypothetical protein
VYTYSAGSPGTFNDLGRISVKIYDTAAERAKAEAEHRARIDECDAKGMDYFEGRGCVSRETEKEQYEALDWNKFTLKEEPPPPPGIPWGTIGIAVGAAAALLIGLKMVVKGKR